MDRATGSVACTMRPMQRVLRVDGHLDLAFLSLQGVDLLAPSCQPSRFGVNLPALHAGGVRLALATIFTERGSADPWGYPGQDSDGTQAGIAGRKQLEIYHRLEDAGSIRIVRRRGDLAGLGEIGPLRVVLLMEGADPIAAPEEAAWWFDQGVRMVGLTWALGSRWAGGNAADGPLTASGRALVQALDSAGMLHDASHLSRAAFEGLMACTDRCVVASHSNAAAIAGDAPRHLTDGQIRAIADRGGLCGLNLYGKFLRPTPGATVSDAVAHVMHVRALAGAGAIALGSDFDGGFTPGDCPEGLGRPEELHNLDAALMAAGLPATELSAFQHGNWLRVLGQALPD
jgi:membrane dipeptidase